MLKRDYGYANEALSSRRYTNKVMEIWMLQGFAKLEVGHRKSRESYMKLSRAAVQMHMVCEC